MVSKEDQKLTALFATLTDPIHDDGFSRQVLRRIDRSRRVRAWTIAVAGTVGALAALWELKALRGLLESVAIRIPADWLALDWLTGNPLLLGATLVAALLLLGFGALVEG